MLFIRRKIGRKFLLAVGVVLLAILAGMHHLYSTHAREIIQRLNEQARGEQIHGIIAGMKAIMMAGHAELAQEYADRLKQTPGLVDLHILRTNGLEAFLDNQTIEAVNFRRNRTLFQPRDDEEERRILPEARLAFLQQTPRPEMFRSFERSREGEPLETFLIAISNDRDCHYCHDKEDAVRGVVMLTTSLASMESAIAETNLKSARFLAIAMVFLLVLLFLILRNTVLQPIQRVEAAMSRVAEGDLAHKVEVRGEDELAHIALTFNDMARQLERTHNGIQQERNKLTTIILSAREGIIITDGQGQVVLVNPAAERLLGKTDEQIIGQGFVNILDDPEFVQVMLENSGINMPDTVVYNEKVLNIHAARIFTGEGVLLGNAALLRDVTEEKKLENELRQLSYTDKLTGLFNRRRLDELLQQEFMRCHRYGVQMSLLLFDVDHFKKFNDQYGHDQGDRVLQAIGRTMAQFFRKTDFPCRYGGEEFCVVLPGIPNDATGMGPHQVADRFRQTVEALEIDGLKVTISIGVSHFINGRYASAEEMIKDADKALYQAKAQGRNRVVSAVGTPEAATFSRESHGLVVNA
ncbi:MAG: diguanylate cyclase [Magnetococcales bacterium]|nr:diguanylate cyclase [Magnetococcales bacterium]